LKGRIEGLRSELLAFENKRQQLLEAEFDYRILLDQITDAEAQERNAARLAAESKKKTAKKEWIRNQ
jgi:hypothetical protein